MNDITPIHLMQHYLLGRFATEKELLYIRPSRIKTDFFFILDSLVSKNVNLDELDGILRSIMINPTSNHDTTTLAELINLFYGAVGYMDDCNWDYNPTEEVIAWMKKVDNLTYSNV